PAVNMQIYCEFFLPFKTVSHSVHSYLVPVTIRRLILSFAPQKSLLTPESRSYVPEQLSAQVLSEQ
ncbi:MAG: hypothetical protein Q4F41_20430, partial [Eubacteriales bacterium]|nr:hypothetical protein [Eubacteriales bacterium]